MAAQPPLRPSSGVTIWTSLSVVAIIVFVMLLAWFPKRSHFQRSTAGVEQAKLSTRPELQRPKEYVSEKLKALYHKLQNLEDFPNVIPQARDTLLEWLSEVLETANTQSSDASNIFSITSYSKEDLARFMRHERDKVAELWHDYVKRRELGQPRERLATREDAKRWLKAVSPLKNVDGAWLGHINKITTPFALRPITKNAWQILSEEYGDGDLEKHHVHVYNILLRTIDADLPQSDDRAFVDPKQWQDSDDPSIWKSAVAQLLISLFPDEFLPEILGFNLHFECVTEETLMTCRELRELGYDPYYFLLHVSIDNMDSGHTAMAFKVATDYMESITAEKNDHKAQRAWKGLQTGYMLSKTLGCSRELAASHHDLVLNGPLVRREQEAAVEKMFKSKALASHRIHCGLKMKIGRRTLDEWLEPEAMASPRWGAGFLHSLGRTKQLVCRGDSGKSKLVHELSWRGKMFGAFTESEVQAVKSWIDQLPPLDQTYWNFIGETRRPSLDGCGLGDSTSGSSPAFLRKATDFNGKPKLYRGSLASMIPMPTKKLCIGRLIPLWFTHPGLLESFISIPSRTATPLGCSILRLIRAQSGFGIETPGVAGIEESRNAPLGISEMGLELIRRQSLTEPRSLFEVLQWWPSGFAHQMLQVSRYPKSQVATLLGFTQAFVELHTLVASTDLLSTPSRDKLRLMAQRETQILLLCLQELRKRGGLYTSEFEAAYNSGREEIEACCN